MPPCTEYRIIRSARRRNVAFRIGSDGIPEILAPAAIPESFLVQLFRREAAAIESLRRRTPVRRQILLSEGAKFLLLGSEYPLHLTRRLRIFDNAFMIPDGSEEEKYRSLVTLYRELARSIICKRVSEWQEKTGLIPEIININSASGRWGSCTAAKKLSFSWKLIQCPRELVDYVIVHELSHLRELNHSPAFWATVAAIMPDHKLKREQLKCFSRTLPEWKN